MTWDNITTIFVAVLTIVGSPILASILNNNSLDRRALSYKRLFDSLREKNHCILEVEEYFNMATGLRLEYDDIKKIVSENNSSWMIYFTKKMPGFIEYENGTFKHSKRFDGKWYLPLLKKASSIINYSGKYLSVFGYFFFSYSLVYFISTSKMTIGLGIFLILMIFLSVFGFLVTGRLQDRDEKLNQLITASKEVQNEG